MIHVMLPHLASQLLSLLSACCKYGMLRWSVRTQSRWQTEEDVPANGREGLRGGEEICEGDSALENLLAASLITLIQNILGALKKIIEMNFVC